MFFTMADILGHVVSVEKVDDSMAQNKPNKNPEFLIRDAMQVEHCFHIIFDS